MAQTPGVNWRINKKDKPMTRNRMVTHRLNSWMQIIGLGVLACLTCASPVAAAPNASAGKAVVTSSTFIDTCEHIYAENQVPLSLDFQNAPIEDVLHVISEVSGLNIVLTPNISGTTTVMLNDVPWGQALDMVLDNAKLGRSCEKNIIRVDTKDAFRMAKAEGKLVTEMVRVNYANLLEVQTRVGGLVTTLGSVSANERTNTLVIMDTEEMVKDLVAVVKNLDIPTPQVQIASKIVQINRNFLQELGLQWGFTTVTQRNPAFPNSIIATGAATGTGVLSGGVGGFDAGNIGGQDGVRNGFMVDLATEQLPFLGLATSLLSRDGDHTLDLQLSAMERQGKSRTIANPKVATADNKQAKIRQGERIPFQTFSQNEGAKTEFVDANLELTVTPHITADQKVYMKVQATQNSPDFANAVGGAPRIDTREATTEVLVQDGGTAILGGLHQRTQVENRRAIPYLADIPIIGLLFKSKLERDTVDELLIFVTPTIIKSEQPNS